MTDDVENRRDLRTQIEASLTYVGDNWGSVLEAEIKGSPRRWAATRMSETEEMDAAQLARIERAEKAVGIGEHPAPMDLGVFDRICDAEKVMTEMRKVCRLRLTAAHERLTKEFDAETDKAKLISIASEMEPFGDLLEALPSVKAAYNPTSLADMFPQNIGWLFDVIDLIEDDVTLTPLAAGSRKLEKIVASVLGDSGERRWDYVACPCCDEKKLSPFIDYDDPARSYIVCAFQGCSGDRMALTVPTTPICGNWDSRGRPFWPAAEFDWLNAEIEARDAARVAAAALTEDVA